MIHIDRNIFKALNHDEALLKNYINGCLDCYINENALDEYQRYVCDGIFSIITKNEALIDKIGMKRYYDEDYKAKEYVDGTYYASGDIVIIPFDWSMSDEKDINWSYSFLLAKVY